MVRLLAPKASAEATRLHCSVAFLQPVDLALLSARARQVAGFGWPASARLHFRHPTCNLFHPPIPLPNFLHSRCKETFCTQYSVSRFPSLTMFRRYAVAACRIGAALWVVLLFKGLATFWPSKLRQILMQIGFIRYDILKQTCQKSDG